MNAGEEEDTSVMEMQDLLQIRWNEVVSAVEACTSLLRKREGCQDAVMRITLEAKKRCHMYTYPAGDQRIPDAVEKRVVCRSVSKKQKMLDGTADLRAKHFLSVTELDYVVSFLNMMSMTQLRRLCSDIRFFSGSKSFTWPSKAEQIYRQLRNEHPPTAPGRSGCTKDRLTLIMRLSAEVDEEWNKNLKLALESGSCIVRRDSTRHSNEYQIPEIEISHIPSRSSETDGFVPGSSVPKDLVNEGQTKFKTIIPLSVEGDLEDHEILKKGISERRLNMTHWMPSMERSDISYVLQMLTTLPRDVHRTSKGKKDWFNLTELRQTMRKCLMKNPRLGPVQWSVQVIPADGNCMFSAVMIAAAARDRLKLQHHTVFGLRVALKNMLFKLAEAGTAKSFLRREWLANCYNELEDRRLRSFCSDQLDLIRGKFLSNDIETFLLPIRGYVRNWAEMVGRDHWGGHFNIEMNILATITNCVIEVFQEDRTGSDDVVKMYDFRKDGDLSHFSLLGTYFPLSASLPSYLSTFLNEGGPFKSNGDWVGCFPLIRVVLDSRHYSACIASAFSPIPDFSGSRNLSWKGYDEVISISEPYADLDENESKVYLKAIGHIETWLHTIGSDVASQHADASIYESRDHHISVSKLSQLQDASFCDVERPRLYMLSDDLISCYMHLMQERHTELLSAATLHGRRPPPKTYYMHGWFYRSIARGKKGPTSKRETKDFAKYSLIVIPALVEGHWVLAICYTHRGIIGVYDPFGHRREDVFKVVREWATVKITSVKFWHFLHVKESRGFTQQGCIDCGVYVCKAAESIGLGVSFRLSQWDIGFVRRRMLVEIMRGEATSLRWPPESALS